MNTGITTAIDYPNGKPHLSQIFEKVLAILTIDGT